MKTVAGILLALCGIGLLVLLVLQKVPLDRLWAIVIGGIILLGGVLIDPAAIRDTLAQLAVWRRGGPPSEPPGTGR